MEKESSDYGKGVNWLADARTRETQVLLMFEDILAFIHN
jgi:hypothetical protein